eukprot:CAMPEP_0170075336 /NCGR_PEP_ID=MMETSP0019_2-20121128/12491_1 /TAXON_ID=98059 /ORGANISM="Dinobryon sp., Strain UTEXLB2267" /LENGTH=297 /DNA_ID=CAMNT_0010286239 /DNA_START=140 /DNA_END=1030 /DNA_ORIENTATION=-
MNNDELLRPCQLPTVTDSSSSIVTFGKFVEDFLPLEKQEQRQLKRHFTDPGNAGFGYKPVLESLRQALRFDPSQFDLQSDTLKGTIYDLLKDGNYHILPSFFKMLATLCERGTDFRLLLRTFGSDTANVVAEFNAFCQGIHPLFNKFYRPSHRKLELRMPAFSARVVRSGPLSQDVYLAHVTSDQTVQVVSESSNIYTHIMHNWFGLPTTTEDVDPQATQPGTYSAAIQDDFQWWASQDERDDSGKLLLINPDWERQQGILQVFFDDNIETDRAHIVDVRHAITFEPIQEVQHKKEW